MKRVAFTLAEVLITLSIIGVVAAITLPPLIQHHNKVVWVNQLKKSVNTLENGFKMAMAEDGVDNLLDTSLWQSATKVNCEGAISYPICSDFVTNLKKYFNIILDNNYRYFSDLNHPGNIVWGSAGDVALNDGSKISFEHIENNVKGGRFSLHAQIATITIDVNGDTPPKYFRA